MLGAHDGAYGFTVGQRRGLRARRARPPDGRPRYVLDIEPVTGTVTVGPAEALDVTRDRGDRPVWTGARRPPAGRVRRAGAGARRGAPGHRDAGVGRDGSGSLTITYAPARGVAPGQAVVLYDGDAVLGSATITRAVLAGSLLAR